MFCVLVIICRQESSEDAELRAALAASVNDTQFKPPRVVWSELWDSSSNDSDITEIPDDEEPARCSNGRYAEVVDTRSCKESGIENGSASNGEKLRIEATSHENSADSDNCVDTLHEVESLTSLDDLPVSAVQEKTGSWKDYFGPESGN